MDMNKYDITVSTVGELEHLGLAKSGFFNSKHYRLSLWSKFYLFI